MAEEESKQAGKKSEGEAASDRWLASGQLTACCLLPAACCFYVPRDGIRS